MDKEKLTAAGLNEDQITNVLKLHKEEIDSNYIPIHRFNEVNTELKTTKTSLTDRDRQIESLKKFEEVLGAIVIGSSLKATSICASKRLTYELLKNQCVNL